MLRRRLGVGAAGVVVVVAALVVTPVLLRGQAVSRPGGDSAPLSTWTPRPSLSGPAPALSGAALAAVRPCTSSDLDPEFYLADGFPDGVARGQIDVVNLSHSSCRLGGAIEFEALTSTGAVLAGYPHGAAAPMSVSGVLEVKGAVVVDIGGDQPPKACSRADLLTPASFVVRIGGVEVTALNRSMMLPRAASTAAPRTALTGCPGTIYADAADVH